MHTAIVLFLLIIFISQHLRTHQLKGNPKTLTPGPWTPTTDRVSGLPTDRSTDYPYGPPPKLKLKEKNRNKDFTYFLSLVYGNRSLVSKFRALRWENVTGWSSVSGATYIIDIPHCHFFLSCGISIYV